MKIKMIKLTRLYSYFVWVMVIGMITSCYEEDSNVMPEEPIVQTGYLHNLRYCEVLVTDFGFSASSLEVFNTTNCNTCPEAEWNALDADSLQAALQSPFVRLNGPRHWLLDSIASSSIKTACDTSFGGIDMSFVASIPLTEEVLLSAQGGYSASFVERNTVYYFYKGKSVYILEDPSGKCYIMQSYSQNIDTNLQLEDLKFLGSRLNLPSGWSFRTTILTNDFILESQNGLAELVSDDLENAYQYLHNGCL